MKANIKQNENQHLEFSFRSSPELFRCTSRHKLNTKNGKWTQTGFSQNTGLLAYSLEEIVSSKLLFNYFGADEIECIYKLIIDQMLIRNSDESWWRWEKNPERPDYLYPIDWDDQLKVTESLVKFYKIHPEKFSDVNFPKKKDVYEKILKCIYSTRKVGEDIIYLSDYKYALYMFDQSDGAKPGNKEDIFVTAVVINSLFELNSFSKEDEAYQNIKKLCPRAYDVAEKALQDHIPFHNISRCYISWAHYIYLLCQINTKYNLNYDVNRLICYYKNYINDKTFDETEKANWMHDRYFQIKLGIMKDVLEGNFPKKNIIVYRHRRLDDYYSSNTWDKVLYKLSEHSN